MFISIYLFCLNVLNHCFEFIFAYSCNLVVFSGEDAAEDFMNLKPFEMKQLLYHILSGNEITFKRGNCVSIVKVFMACNGMI